MIECVCYEFWQWYFFAWYQSVFIFQRVLGRAFGLFWMVTLNHQTFSIWSCTDLMTAPIKRSVQRYHPAVNLLSSDEFNRFLHFLWSHSITIYITLMFRSMTIVITFIFHMYQTNPKKIKTCWLITNKNNEQKIVFFF